MRILLLLVPWLTACTNIFLQPDRVDYGEGVRKAAIVEEGFFPAHDGLKLHYWWLPAQSGAKDNNKKLEPKGVIIHLHGNAQNLTSHVRNVGWLTAAGYDVFTFDYRGYGKSEGKKDIDGAFRDVQSALDFSLGKAKEKKLPAFIYGQSLGGTLVMKAFSKEPKRWAAAGIIIEGSFVDYQQIAREKLALSWVTWLFQWLSYVFVSGEYSLKQAELEAVSPTPVWLFYSQDDPIVPVHNGRTLEKFLKDPKKLYEYPEFGHVNAMWVQNGHFREVLLRHLQNPYGRQPAN